MPLKILVCDLIQRDGIMMLRKTGFEVEENLAPQKLALLRQNYAQTGRADAGHAVIDISTFPDRFHIPG